MILLIDNYDSFVFTVARYLAELDEVPRVIRNDAIDVSGILELGPAAIVLSPGPCAPEDAGNCLAFVRELSGKIPMLGICLATSALVRHLAVWCDVPKSRCMGGLLRFSMMEVAFFKACRVRSTPGATIRLQWNCPPRGHPASHHRPKRKGGNHGARPLH